MLTPEQVATMWDLVAHALINVSKVPASHQQEYLNDCHIKIQSGNKQVWALYDKTPEDRVLHAVMITGMVKDSIMGVKILVIEALYGIRVLDAEIARDGIDGLVQFGKANGCDRLSMLTSSSRVSQLGKIGGMEEFATVYVREI